MVFKHVTVWRKRTLIVKFNCRKRNEEPTRKVKLSENIWLLQRLFLFVRMLRFCFLQLNLTISVLFLQQWHAQRSSGFTSWLVSKNVLQMLLSRTSLPIVAGTGFISSDSWPWYWALLAAFLSNWTILSLSNWLQFLLTVSPEERISYYLRKSLKWLVRSANRQPSVEWHCINLQGAMMVESHWWVSNMKISILLKRLWSSYVSVSMKQEEYYIYMAQLSLQFL